MKIRLAVLIMLIFCLPSMCQRSIHVFAQVPPDSVLQNAEDVFSRPEFQRYKNQKPSAGKNPFGSSSGTPGSGGSSREGSTNGEGNDSGAGENGETNSSESGDERRDRSSNPSSQPSRDSGSSSYRGGSFGDFGAGMAGLFKILGIVALVLMVGMILWLVIPTLFNQDRTLEDTTKGDLLMSLEDGEQGNRVDRRSMQEYLSHAREMADRSQYREAVAYVLLAAMAEITERGLVTQRIGLTHRDYYRAVRRHPELSQEYLKILKIYEPLAFGRRSAELSHYQLACEALEAGFRETQTIS